MRQLRDQFGTWTLALAAYNWGPGNLSKARDPAKWPSETRTYVDEITRNAGLA
jgi:soluble lytic murein transglycosylase-like protein